MTILRLHRFPGPVLPVAGGLLFATLIGVWYTSALWLYGGPSTAAEPRRARLPSLAGRRPLNSSSGPPAAVRVTRWRRRTPAAVGPECRPTSPGLRRYRTGRSQWGADAAGQGAVEPGADPRRRSVRDRQRRRKLRAVIAHTVADAGRPTLAVNEQGDPAGLPVFVHHGTPSSGLLYEPWVRTPRERHPADRLRPRGYGGSSATQAGAGAVAADVDAIAGALGLERFATWGISGGGPHALACAALCDGRLDRGGEPGGRRAVGADGLDWLAGWARQHRGVRARARRRGGAAAGDRARPSGDAGAPGRSR